MHIPLLRSAVVILGVAAGVGARDTRSGSAASLLPSSSSRRGAPPPGKPRNIPHTHERAGFPLCLRNHLEPSFTPSVRGNYVGGAARRTVANRAAGTRAPGAGTTPAAPGFPPAFVSSGPTAAATRAAPVPTSPMVQTCQTPSKDFMAASRTSRAQDESRPVSRCISFQVLEPRTRVEMLPGAALPRKPRTMAILTMRCPATMILSSDSGS